MRILLCLQACALVSPNLSSTSPVSVSPGVCESTPVPFPGGRFIAALLKLCARLRTGPVPPLKKGGAALRDRDVTSPCRSTGASLAPTSPQDNAQRVLV